MGKVGEDFAKSYPVRAMSLDLTENCSLRCKYCFCGEKTTRDIDEKTAKDAIDWLISPKTSGKEKNLTVDFWGGEPMLRWDLAKELISHGNRRASKYGKTITWNMTTNGVHMDEKHCKEVRLANGTFMLSLDGDRETQDGNRPLAGGGSSYDRITANLPHMLTVMDGHLRARLTVNEETVGRLAYNVRHMHEDLKIPQIAFSLAHESLWVRESLDELENQLNQIADWYVAQKRAGNEALFVKMIDDGVERLLYPKQLKHFCGAGRGYLSVSVDGVIYACHRFHEFTDERPWEEHEYSLGTIYDELTKPRVREQFLVPQLNEKCLKCSVARGGNCQGSCYAANWAKSGNIYLPTHSQCAEMKIARKIATRVYNELINEPAFRANLRRLARQRGRACREPGKEFYQAISSEAIDEAMKVEIDVLDAALKTIQEAVAAINNVVANSMTERQLRVEMLTRAGEERE